MTEKKKKTTVKKQAKTSGIVSNCNFLNVRQEANEASNIIRILNEGTKIKIIPNKSIVGWYCVLLDDGVSGFCMKKYIK